MSVRKQLTIVLGVGGFVAAGIGGLIYYQMGALEKARAELVSKNDEIDAARKLVARIPQLERDVIIQRETDEAIREILPNEKEITNYMRTLQSFAEQSSVQITSLKPKAMDRDEKAGKVDFQKVGYGITFDGDAFQLLAFLSFVESHPRLMSVNSFKLKAAKVERVDRVKDGEAVKPVMHEVQLDVETYVYQPKTGSKSVKIESYERKRDLLAGEISKRRSALVIPAYNYEGQRGRRDPWVDPRVPVKQNDPENMLSIEKQIELVESMRVRVAEIQAEWDLVRTTESEIEKMKAGARLEPNLARMEQDIRNVLLGQQLTYLPADKAFRTEVVAAVKRVRDEQKKDSTVGPSTAVLNEAIASMKAAMEEGDYDTAKSVFATVEPSLALAEADKDRKELVIELRQLESEASIVMDFEKIAIAVTGVLISEGQPAVAVINGMAVEVGDMLDGGLLVHAIHEDEIEFVYRGVVLSRQVGS